MARVFCEAVGHKYNIMVHPRDLEGGAAWHPGQTYSGDLEANPATVDNTTVGGQRQQGFREWEWTRSPFAKAYEDLVVNKYFMFNMVVQSNINSSIPQT